MIDDITPEEAGSEAEEPADAVDNEPTADSENPDNTLETASVQAQPDETGGDDHGAGEVPPPAVEDRGEAGRVIGNIDRFYEGLNELMRERETLKLRWVDIEIDAAYHRDWEADVTRLFQIEVNLRNRKKRIRDIKGL